MRRVVIGLLTMLLILGISTSSVLATDTNYGSVDRYVSQENNNNDDQGISDVQEYDAEFEYDDFVYEFYNRENNYGDMDLSLAYQTNNDDNYNEQDQGVMDPRQILLP